MASISTVEVIRTMLENNGTYPGDPQALGIYEVENVLFGTVHWAVAWSREEREAIYSSPAFGTIVPLWMREHGFLRPIGTIEAMRKDGDDNGV